jgi:hypothetical protein
MTKKINFKSIDNLQVVICYIVGHKNKKNKVLIKYKTEKINSKDN